MPQSILVTGGASDIASHSSNALARAGYGPVAYDNLSREHRAALRRGPLVKGDVGDRGRRGAAVIEHRVSAVIHFAAGAEEAVDNSGCATTTTCAARLGARWASTRPPFHRFAPPTARRIRASSFGRSDPRRGYGNHPLWELAEILHSGAENGAARNL
jgi:NAD(P)-dependent dehydrogenase (short-subunit alcohol dehydrogenase family)